MSHLKQPRILGSPQTPQIRVSRGQCSRGCHHQEPLGKTSLLHLLVASLLNSRWYLPHLTETPVPRCSTRQWRGGDSNCQAVRLSVTSCSPLSYTAAHDTVWNLMETFLLPNKKQAVLFKSVVKDSVKRKWQYWSLHTFGTMHSPHHLESCAFPTTQAVPTPPSVSDEQREARPMATALEGAVGLSRAGLHSHQENLWGFS